MKPHWVIIGAGNIGCLWASKLSHAGIKPTLLLRQKRYNQLIQKDIATITMTDICGNYSNVTVTLATPKNISRPIDILVVCTKAQDASDAVQSIKHHLHATSIILLLQNGMGSQQTIASSFPTQSVWAGSITDGVYSKKTFVFCHAGKGKTLIGHLSGPSLPENEPFLILLRQLQLTITIVPNIEQRLWDKLAVSSCINGLTALYNCKNGELLNHENKRKHLYRLIHETQHLLERLGKAEGDSVAAKVEEVCKTTAHNISSTCYDARIERSTELAFINKFLIQTAISESIPLKEHAQLLTALKEQGVKI